MVRYSFDLTRIMTVTSVALALSTGAAAQTKEQPSDTQPQAEQTGQKLQEQTTQEPSARQSAKDQPAAEAQAPSPPDGPFIAEQEEETLLASELQGLTIVSADGEEIGEIEDLILHPEGGIFGATVSVGGFLGVGGKEVALSWKQFDYTPEEQLARVDLTRQQLEEAPDFRSLADMRAEQEAAAAQQRMMQQQGGTPSATGASQ